MFPNYLFGTQYDVTATSTSGRDGTVSSTPTDGTASLNLKLTVPKAIGGRGDEGHNPEQLFAAGYSACFLGAIQAAATKQGKKEVGAQAVVHADVTLGRPTDRAGYGLKVVLRVENVDDQAIVDAAHEMCPYSRALREGVVVNIQKA
ncbi:peroxiredoxin, Ohr subfamily [Multifurca ochricompacta]|uniref:Peroxiredoxin, Ohr subfamily n=1 Tax=Multifurca ochricompacta TaxID=376703 RepID=A0AAD4M8R8_9AGAM|nr:peroxiredoxin, Ohr subfamily [Multifurca ochricompacta]